MNVDEDEDSDGSIPVDLFFFLFNYGPDDEYADYDSDLDAMPSASGVINADPYAGKKVFFRQNQRLSVASGIFFSKDRKEEVIEIEEVPETMQLPGTNEMVPLLTQGQWMKGCPEGSEQSFLFSLYSKLSTPFQCPQDCGASIPRRKGDFFALYVSLR